MARAFAKKFYSSKQWQDCRNAYARHAHYLCEDCLRRGIYKPGEIVHHKIEVSPRNIDNPEITLNFNNLELLCRECHEARHNRDKWGEVNKKKREKKLNSFRYEIGENGKVFAR